MNNKVVFLNLHSQFEQIKTEVHQAIERVLASQHFILGPEVISLENNIAPYVGCKHAVGVSSGSDALLLSLLMLDMKSNDEVITTPYTFFATAGAIARLGCKIVFVDVEETSFNMNPHQLESKITKNTKAIIPIHLFGQAADLQPIMKIAKDHNIAVIEDAAQAIGSEYQKKRVGSFGLLSCFSFFPSKNLGAMGDAGMVTTNDPTLLEKAQIFRSHGAKPKYYHQFIGGNFRLDALQAAILNAKFKYLEQWTKQRIQNANYYDQLLQQAGVEGLVTKPWRRVGDRHIFNQYVIQVQNRDHLRSFLNSQGIQTEIYYPLPLHLQKCFEYLGYQQGDFPVSEKMALCTLALPIYSELPKEQQEYVIDQIKQFYSTNGKR